MRNLLITPITDWKNSLPARERKVLRRILKKVKRYRASYANADEPSIAQLWCAIVMIAMEIEELRRRIEDLRLKEVKNFERSKKSVKEREEIKRIMESF